MANNNNNNNKIQDYILNYGKASGNKINDGMITCQILLKLKEVHNFSNFSS